MVRRPWSTEVTTRDTGGKQGDILAQKGRDAKGGGGVGGIGDRGSGIRYGG
jgi:hypothetical protein